MWRIDLTSKECLTPTLHRIAPAGKVSRTLAKTPRDKLTSLAANLTLGPRVTVRWRGGKIRGGFAMRQTREKVRKREGMMKTSRVKRGMK